MGEKTVSNIRTFQGGLDAVERYNQNARQPRPRPDLDLSPELGNPHDVSETNRMTSLLDDYEVGDALPWENKE